ncbi:amidohydrolase family protein [Spirosoma sp. SC4-14]|uniref:amidohydrolase family protein n=1 Tax=Spirosoma sp. SC4-14 TaxID=3128900 RepID=UPI0030D2A00C
MLIHQGKIAAVGNRKQVKIPEGIKQLDCSGLVMTAGFWNCHVHFMEPQWQRADSLPASRLNQQLESMLTQYGFTYAFDLATLDLSNLLRLRHRIETGEVDGPTIFTAGVPFTPQGGSPFYIAPLKLPEIDNPRQASDYVNKQLAAGADAIKLWSASPTGRMIIPMKPDVIKAAVVAAHAQNKPVFAHPSNNDGVLIAIEGGVDILTHVSPDDRKGWSDETIRRMLMGKMALIPTLKLYKWDLERLKIPTENNSLITTAVQQLASYANAGGQILFGTDTGFMPDYSPADEYILMEAAGMTFPQILTALTTAPAKRFGTANYTGQITTGMDADLVVLSADPATDIKSLSSVAYTIRKGKIIYRHP